VQAYCIFEPILNLPFPLPYIEIKWTWKGKRW